MCKHVITPWPEDSGYAPRASPENSRKATLGVHHTVCVTCRCYGHVRHGHWLSERAVGECRNGGSGPHRSTVPEAIPGGSGSARSGARQRSACVGSHMQCVYVYVCACVRVWGAVYSRRMAHVCVCKPSTYGVKAGHAIFHVSTASVTTHPVALMLVVEAQLKPPEKARALSRPQRQQASALTLTLLPDTSRSTRTLVSLSAHRPWGTSPS